MKRKDKEKEKMKNKPKDKNKKEKDVSTILSTYETDENLDIMIKDIDKDLDEESLQNFEEKKFPEKVKKRKKQNRKIVN